MSVALQRAFINDMEKKMETNDPKLSLDDFITKVQDTEADLEREIDPLIRGLGEHPRSGLICIGIGSFLISFGLLVGWILKSATL